MLRRSAPDQRCRTRSCKRLEKRIRPLMVEVGGELLLKRRGGLTGVCYGMLVVVGAARAPGHVFCA